MNKITNVLTLGLIIILFSCGRQKVKNNILVNITDTTKTNLDKNEKARLAKSKEIDEENNSDSLNLDRILNNAIKIAEQNKDFDTFKKEYKEIMPDSSEVEVNVSSDFYFTKKNPHLIIRRNTPVSIYIDIFSKKNNRFHKVVSHEQGNMTYVNDTIRDINGDGFNDFVVNWYGSSGCCLKAFSNVYLLRSNKKTFSINFEFINPTFSPKEKIIRGVCYGHPSDTEMYKYKWNGEIVDTLEYIFYEKDEKGNKTGKIIISNDVPYGKKFKIIKRLNSVPYEYKLIEGYDWFTGKGYE